MSHFNSGKGNIYEIVETKQRNVFLVEMKEDMQGNTNVTTTPTLSYTYLNKNLQNWQPLKLKTVSSNKTRNIYGILHLTHVQHIIFIKLS